MDNGRLNPPKWHAVPHLEFVSSASGYRDLWWARQYCLTGLRIRIRKSSVFIDLPDPNTDPNPEGGLKFSVCKCGILNTKILIRILNVLERNPA
jgi:hypothetical protein